MLEGQEHPVSLLDLPTVVESYKTLDDINLVKMTDIGQVRLPPCPGHCLSSFESAGAGGGVPSILTPGLLLLADFRNLCPPKQY